MAVVSVSGARDDGAVDVVPAGVWRLVDRHQRLPVRRLHPKPVAGLLAGRKLKADFLTVWRRRQAQRRPNDAICAARPALAIALAAVRLRREPIGYIVNLENSALLQHRLYGVRRTRLRRRRQHGCYRSQSRNDSHNRPHVDLPVQ